MAVKVSNCRSSDGNTSPGDQSTNEYRIQNWWGSSSYWKCIIRHPDKDVRAYIASLAKSAATNNHIGYSQIDRNSFWTEVQKVSYKPEDIKTDCNADCSSSTSCICRCVGYRLNISKLKNISKDATTYDMEDKYKSAGFKILSDIKYRNSSDYLVAGDILLSSGHTCIVVSNGSKVSDADKTKILDAGSLQSTALSKVKLPNGMSLSDLVDPKRLSPYIAILDSNSPDLNYKKLKESQVFAVMIEAGSYYNASHTVRSKYETNKLQSQVEAAQAADVPYALYVHVRSTTVKEANKELTALKPVIQKYVPTFGVWLRLHLSAKKDTNNKIIDNYKSSLEDLGLKGKIGIYVTRKELESIDWTSKRWNDWYLWIIDRINKIEVLDELLTPDFFMVETK